MSCRRFFGALAAALLAVSGAAPQTAAIGLFSQNLRGVSTFVEEGSTIHLRGAYAGLNPKRSYFSVLYGNGNCDPAQAFPVGPFRVRGNGAGGADVVAPNPAAAGMPLIDVAKTGSISVRIGDTDRKGNPTDQDGDGNYGATDVVAVAGQPSIGLVECDTSPFRN